MTGLRWSFATLAFTLRLAIGFASGFARYPLRSPLPPPRACPPRGSSGRTPAGSTPREPSRPRLRDRRPHASAPDASLRPGRQPAPRLPSGALFLFCGSPPGSGPKAPARLADGRGAAAEALHDLAASRVRDRGERIVSHFANYIVRIYRLRRPEQKGEANAGAQGWDTRGVAGRAGGG